VVRSVFKKKLILAYALLYRRLPYRGESGELTAKVRQSVEWKGTFSTTAQPAYKQLTKEE